MRLPATADVIVAPQAVLDDAASSSTASVRVSIGRVGVGVGVRAGAERPEISSGEAPKTELASAGAVVYNRASTGLWIETVLQRLGMAESAQPKAVRERDASPGPDTPPAEQRGSRDLRVCGHRAGALNSRPAINRAA